MIIDLERCRNETPAVKELLHFNNAGCSLSPASVTAAVIEHLELEQAIGGYEAANAANDKIDGFYSEFAKLLNCSASQIAYIENASRAWDMALYSVDWQAGDQIITADNEYVSNYLALLHLQKQKNIEIVLVPCNELGHVDLDKLRCAITSKTKMIALTHVSSQRGDIQPASQVGAIAKEHDLLYLLDACQSVGQIDLDTQELGCDFLCGTGRKYLRGPRGTGFLYASTRAIENSSPIFVDNHSAHWTGPASYSLSVDAKKFETWERNIAGKIGLTEAVRYANELGMGNIELRVRMLARELNSKLISLNNVSVFERSTDLSGIVTFQKKGFQAAELARLLFERKINTSISKQENSQLDLAANNIGDVNRASIHYYNTSDEIDRFVDAVAQC